MADLQRGTSYAVRARAVNAIGAGPFSPTAVFSTRAGERVVLGGGARVTGVGVLGVLAL